MGPVAFREHLRRCSALHRRRRGDEGARLVAGGARPDARSARGFFVEPTSSATSTNDMRIAREEIFGPVLAALRFADEEEARRASPTTRRSASPPACGRATSARAPDRARLRAGTVWINAYRTVGPMAPFGGFKASGMGRENGLEAIAEYTETKTVWVELSGATRDPFKLG